MSLSSVSSSGISTYIMYQHAGGGNIIGMIIRNLEVIDLYRAFKNLIRKE